MLRIELRRLVQIHRRDAIVGRDSCRLGATADGPILDSLAVDPDQWVLGLPVTAIHAP